MYQGSMNQLRCFGNLDVLRAASDHTVKHMNGTFSSVPPSSEIKVPRTL
jgi:hypothetical protein